MHKLQRYFILIGIVLLAGLIVVRIREAHRIPVVGDGTIASRVKEFGPSVKKRLLPHFQRAGVPYPPDRVLLVGFKYERQLELYAAGAAGSLKFIRVYSIEHAGEFGPKLEGYDRKVPEGFYRIESLNPKIDNNFNDIYLSMQLDYPNAFDRSHGATDGSEVGEIVRVMIQESSGSTGCIGMGAQAVEDLFVLAAQVGVQNVSVILSPVNFRFYEMPWLTPNATPLPLWTRTLYPEIREALNKLPKH